MNIKELDIAGCYLVTLPHFKDERGTFVKTFHEENFKGTALEGFELKEEFYSVSKQNVLRGLHFQTPPAAHDKLVYCIQGLVIDFFLDIRTGSKTYGKHLIVELSAEKPELLFLPKGIAHGFLTQSEYATLVYKTNYMYSPEHDDGILWSSLDLDLPEADYIVSERDQSFLDVKNYKSPF